MIDNIDRMILKQVLNATEKQTKAQIARAVGIDVKELSKRLDSQELKDIIAEAKKKEYQLHETIRTKSLRKLNNLIESNDPHVAMEAIKTLKEFKKYPWSK